MKRTMALRSAAVLGVASMTLAACVGGNSSSESTSAAPATSAVLASSAAPSAAASAVPSAAASVAPISTGTPLYLVDGNTGNALGEKLPVGTLTGVKGTIPGAPTPQAFKDELLAVNPDLKDFAYAPEAYDAVILAALAAAKANSDAGVDMAKQLVPITQGTESCDSYAACLQGIKDGKEIDYQGRSGPIDFSDAGDPTSASVGVYQFSADNTLLPDVNYVDGAITPDKTSDPIDGAVQKGAGDGIFTVGTFLPVTGNLSYLGPPPLAGVKLAIKDIEAAGGIPGIDSIVLQEGDSGDTSTNTGQQTVKRLLPLGIDLLIGAQSSNSTLSVLDQVTGAGVLMISPANTAPQLTVVPDHGLYWRTAPPDVLQGAVLGSMVVQDGHNNVAILSMQDSYGDGLNVNVTKAILEGGGKVVANVVYDPKADDFAADVAKVKKTNPDAIVLIGFDESAKVIAEMVKQGIGPNSAG